MLSADTAILLEKLENPYAQDSNPTGLANAILTSNLNITPLDGNLVERNLDKPFSGSDPAILTSVHVSASFDVELAANGTSGAGITAPGWGVSIQASGFDEFVDTTPTQEKVEYTLSDFSNQDALSSVSSYANLSGQEHKMLGCRGGWAIKVGRDGIPMVSLTRKGLYVAPASVPFPTADFSAFQDPLAVDNDNTPTINLHGYPCKLYDLEINSGISPQIINIPGEESVRIPKYDITGKIVIAAPAISDQNFFAIAKAHTLGALSFQHGVNGGEIVQLDDSAIQILNPRYGNIDDIRTLEMDLRFTGNAFKITTK